MALLTLRSGLMAAALAAGLTLPAMADDLAIPAGTAVQVQLENVLSSDALHKGDTFKTTVLRQVTAAGGDVLIPMGTVITGRIEGLHHGIDGSGSIEVRFVSMALPGGESRDIKGRLAAFHDEVIPASVAAKVPTAPRIDVLLVGESMIAGREATTLVGIDGEDDGPLGRHWKGSGLGPGPVRVMPGAIMMMTLEEPVSLGHLVRRTS
jgi:hypothetical protein